MAIFTLTAGLDNLTGTAAADSFNVTLFANFGATDTVVGGAGIDTLNLNFTGTGVLVLGDRATEIELVALGGTASIGVDARDGDNALAITGNAGNNAITGTFLADTITGGAGNDILSGGDGNDVFLVSLAGDMGLTEILNGGSGVDVLRFTGATGTLVLGASVFELEQVVIGTAAGVTTGTAALNVDATAVLYGISITGNAGANVLTGTAYNDTLLGGGGNDVFIIKRDLHHGAGETIDGGAGTNTIRFTSTTPTDVLALSANITGIAEVELSDAAGVNTGTAAIGVDASALSTGMLFTGNAGANGITGTGGNDVFVITLAADHPVGEAIDGGLGADTIRFADVVAGHTLTLRAGVTNIENIVLASATGVATAAAVNINAAASADNLNITGNVAANALTGGEGNDTITGGAGADLLNGGAGNDLFLVASVAELPATESITGGADTDVVRLTGVGTYAITNLIDVERVEAAPGSAAINVSAVARTTGIRITGNDAANTLTGGAGNDTLEGGAGNDIFVIGNFAHHGATEVIDGGGNTDTIQFAGATGTLALAAGVTGVENVTITSAAAVGINAAASSENLNITGNAAINSLTGGSGNDTITGGAGADILAGGAGNDLFVIAAVADLPATESINGGADTDVLRLVGAGTYALTDGIVSVEQVAAASGTAAINISAVARTTGIRITGNDAANTLTGGAGNDTLEGGVGNDVFVIGNFAHHGASEVIDGGAGTADTIQFTSATAGQTLTLQAGVTGVENVAITSLVAQNVNAAALTYGINLTGNAVANSLTGGSGYDTIGGGAGNDTIDGGGGADTITGGAGNDSLDAGAGDDLFLVALVADLTATEQVNGGADFDTLRLTGAGTYVLPNISNVERVEAAVGVTAININASAVAACIEIAGNSAANVLTGGAGNDTLIGGAGADNLAGGAGNDIFLIGSSAELPASETINGGLTNDTIRFTSATAGETLTLGTLIVSIEAVALADAAGDTSGITALNVDASLKTSPLAITGNDGANIIAGGSGNDTIAGGGGADLLAGMSGADVIEGGAGNDTLSGGAGSDTLSGGAGADILKGGMGNDTLEIAADSELVAGDEMHGGSGTADTIALTGSGQTLDLTTLANSAISGVEIFDLSGTGDNKLILAPSDVAALGVTTLRIDGDAGDLVDSGMDWVRGADTTINTETYKQFTHAGAPGVTVQVQDGVAFVASEIQLSSLNGVNGFQINGEESDDNSGRAVFSAGDVNGDGFGDVIIGAYDSDPAGASYVVFGQASGFATNLELSALDGANGFRISGELADDKSGRSVASAGDVNGDRFDDLIIGAPGAPYGGETGASYVVFGQDTFGPNFELLALTGSDGFRISGVLADDKWGWSVSSAGDVNGDGFGDVIIGAYDADPAGASYVVFGQASGFAANLDLSALNGTNGFRLSGELAEDRSGYSVSSAGDVNGDGFDDVIVGAFLADPNGTSSGASYVVFGQATFGSNLDLSALTGIDGFRISGEAASDLSGQSVSAAGDVNGDGFGDLIIGASLAPGGAGSGASHVVFGQAAGFAANLDLAALDGTNGFRISGELAGDKSGWSVSSAGDVNGDGFDDLIVGAYGADPNGSFSGASYVVFGQAAGFASNLDLSALDGTNGFQISGESGFDLSGISVSSAGDMNGDGFDDLIVGANGADPNSSYSGASYVLFGRDFTNQVDQTGTSGNDILLGGAGNDSLDGGAGNDVLRGGAGNDSFTYDAGDREIAGGSGTDTLTVSGTGVTLDLTAAAEARVSGMEVIDLTGSGANTLAIDLAGLVAQTEGVHVLSVKGGADDAVTGGDLPWIIQGQVNIGGVDYTQYTHGPATLNVQVGVDTSGIITPPANIALSALDGTNGFKLSGVAASDFAGGAVSDAGDVNGDGFGDFIVGANLANPNGNENAGASYVVFGSASGFASNINLSALDGTNGFRISGEAAGDYSGSAVAGAGDINGDGYDDLVIGADGADPGGDLSGAGYVLFGHGLTFASNVNLSALDGTTGFRISGEAANFRTGIAVSSAGDVNGDGFDDVLVGTQVAIVHGFAIPFGGAYVVFGHASGFNANLDVTALDGANGFRVLAPVALDGVGRSVAAAGDVNGDGFGDLVLGAYSDTNNGHDEAGASYVIFGGASGFGSSFELSALSGANGFRISGVAANDEAGKAVSAAGDVNGDGFGDLIVGSHKADPNGDLSGASYVVFGQASGFASNLDLSSLDGSNGFRISGEATRDFAGRSVSSAGDVNGDGYDDLLVGADGANPGYSGASYVVFGKASGFASNLDLTSLDGMNGFQVSGVAGDDYSGSSVSAAGDVNGDGFDDLLIGAPKADSSGSDSGAAYVLFGSDFRYEIDQIGDSAANTLTGTAANEILIGGLGNDTLDGAGGNDVLRGGGDGDIIAGGFGNDLLEGGAGGDLLDGGAGEDRIFGGEGADTLNGGDGNDMLTGGGDNDAFVFNDALGVGVDTIMDFGGAGSTALDVIQLDSAIFTQLAAGALSATNFVANATGVAMTADQFIIYNTVTGALYYDADGDDVGVAVLFAVIATDPDGLTADDFTVL